MDVCLYVAVYEQVLGFCWGWERSFMLRKKISRALFMWQKGQCFVYFFFIQPHGTQICKICDFTDSNHHGEMSFRGNLQLTSSSCMYVLYLLFFWIKKFKNIDYLLISALSLSRSLLPVAPRNTIDVKTDSCTKASEYWHPAVIFSLLETARHTCWATDRPGLLLYNNHQLKKEIRLFNPSAEKRERWIILTSCDINRTVWMLTVLWLYGW